MQIWIKANSEYTLPRCPPFLVFSFTCLQKKGTKDQGNQICKAAAGTPPFFLTILVQRSHRCCLLTDTLTSAQKTSHELCPAADRTSFCLSLSRGLSGTRADSRVHRSGHGLGLPIHRVRRGISSTQVVSSARGDVSPRPV